jgi:hypothetical protein
MNIVLDEAIENVSTSEKNNIGMVVCDLIRRSFQKIFTSPAEQIGIYPLCSIRISLLFSYYGKYIFSPPLPNVTNFLYRGWWIFSVMAQS